MRIDVIIESDKSADEYLKLGKLAEENGLGGVWIANNSNGRDAFVNFVPTAQQTEKIFMGPIAVSPFELHPHKMAVSLLTFNELSQGRGQIVIGAGGGTAEALGVVSTVEVLGRDVVERHLLGRHQVPETKRHRV